MQWIILLRKKLYSLAEVQVPVGVRVQIAEYAIISKEKHYVEAQSIC